MVKGKPIGRVASGAGIACFVLAAFFAVSPAKSAPAGDAAARLLEASGFDDMVRLDAMSDAAIHQEIPESLPRELHQSIVEELDRSLEYAEIRRVMAEAVSARLDPKQIQRHMSWWSTEPGRAVAAAQSAAFRDLVTPGLSTAPAPKPSVELVLQRSPFAGQLPGIAGASLGVRECLASIVSFRRACEAAATGSAHGTSIVLLSNYSSLSGSNRDAYVQYLDSPGAAESMKALGDAYLQTRQARAALAQRAIGAAIARFARPKIGGESNQVLLKVIALIDSDEKLEEARMILHLLRSVESRDPRIPVELARVAIKQGPLMAPRGFRGDPPAIQASALDDAKSWIDLAIALEPKRADTLVLAGHLSYLMNRNPEAIDYLEEARRIGTTNPWLPLNLADALWAQGRIVGLNRDLIGRAALELEGALARELPARLKSRANYALAHIYVDLGEYDKARVQFRQVISASSHFRKAALSVEYARFLYLTAGEMDEAIAVMRASLQIDDNDRAHQLLSQMLLAKAGKLYLEGRRDEAERLVKEALREEPDLAHDYSRYARLARSLPSVYALRESGAVRDFSSVEGGRTLLHACNHAGAADIERLIKWGANPNYLDPGEGTPLQVAIRAANLDAVRALLVNGADAKAKDRQGRLPFEMAAAFVDTSSPQGKELLAVLRKAAR
jgi:tetratricopeptide (TPR) repeat protein